MKHLLSAITLCIILANPAFSQNKDALIKEAEEKLKTRQASISQLLTDKRYDAVHPETAFRNIIEKYCKAEIISIVTDTIPGKKIKVTVAVIDREGKPVDNALVYLYHTDSRGWYAADAPHVSMNEGDMRHARLFGYVKTDKNGLFEMHTIKPSGYPQSDLPAHIHVHVTKDGYRPFVNEFLFDDDERLVGKIRENSINNRFIIAKPGKADPPFLQKFSYTVTLQRN